MKSHILENSKLYKVPPIGGQYRHPVCLSTRDLRKKIDISIWYVERGLIKRRQVYLIRSFLSKVINLKRKCKCLYKDIRHLIGCLQIYLQSRGNAVKWIYRFNSKLLYPSIWGLNPALTCKLYRAY